MRNLVLACSLFSAFQLLAQDSLLKIDELRPPSSPGFSILGVQPTDISRPKSWRDVETNVSSSFFQDNKIVVPKNFAMEFNPFFTVGLGNTEPDPSYIYRKDAGDRGKTIRYNSAISVATGEFKSYQDTSQLNPRMGIGYRTQFVEFQTTAEAKQKYAELVVMMDNINWITFALRAFKDTAKYATVNGENIVELLRAKVTALVTDSTQLAGCLDIISFMQPQLQSVDTSAGRKLYVLNLQNVILLYTDEYKFQSTRDFVAAGMQNRYGWCVEGAAAFMVDFPTNDIGFSKVPKFGFWGTYTYRSENQHWEIAGLSRFITSKFDTLARYNNFDFGIRGMLANEKWSINAEYVQRLQFRLVEDKPVSGGENQATFRYSLDYKLAFTVNYKLTDDIIVNYTFGNNLYINTELENDGAKVNSNVGLVYAFGGPQLKDVAK